MKMLGQKKIVTFFRFEVYLLLIDGQTRSATSVFFCMSRFQERQKVRFITLLAKNP